MPPCQPVTVPIVTSTGPGGLGVRDVQDLARPARPEPGASAGRAAGRSRPAARGRWAAATPGRRPSTTLPSRAVRRTAGSSERRRPGRPGRRSSRAASTRGGRLDLDRLAVGQPQVRQHQLVAQHAAGRAALGRDARARRWCAGRAAAPRSRRRDPSAAIACEVQPHDAVAVVARPSRAGRAVSGRARAGALRRAPRRSTSRDRESAAGQRRRAAPAARRRAAAPSRRGQPGAALGAQRRRRRQRVVQRPGGLADVVGVDEVGVGAELVGGAGLRATAPATAPRSDSTGPSLATRFMPSRSGLTSRTSASEYAASERG